MKSRFFLIFSIGILLILSASIASAIVVYGDWEDTSQEITINKGEGVDFYAEFFSMSAPMEISIKLYDSGDNLIYIFENNKLVNSNGYNKIYSLNENIYGDEGVFEVVLSGTDNFPDSDSHTLTLNVVGPGAQNNAPVAQNSSITTDFETAVSISLQATDADNDSLTFEIVSKPSNGAISGFDSITGQLTYTPDSDFSGEDSFTFRANDGQEDSNTASVSITVNPDDTTPSNNAPVINSEPVKSVDEKEVYTYQVEASDPENDTLTFSLTEAPGFLSINSTSGLITGTALEVDSDTDFNVTVSVSDGEDSDSQSYVLTVNNVPSAGNNPPVINSEPIKSVDENQDYEYQVNASDTDKDTLTYSLTKGPSWLSINSTGFISGRAPGVDSDTNFNVTILVSDGIDSDTQSYFLTVNDNGGDDDNGNGDEKEKGDDDDGEPGEKEKHLILGTDKPREEPVKGIHIGPSKSKERNLEKTAEKAFIWLVMLTLIALIAIIAIYLTRRMRNGY